MKYKETLIEYFKLFSEKNISDLQNMFSDDVILVDWNIFASGKEKVVEANKNIFESVNTIEVTPICFYSNSDFSYSVQILIIVNDEERLDVIDNIKFNNEGLITSIEAYKKD